MVMHTSTEGNKPEARILTGLGVSPGIAIGSAYVYARPLLSVERKELAAEETETEADHFEWTVRRAERDLTKILAVAHKKLGADDDSLDIFDAQLLMLRDDALYEEVLHLIRHQRYSAEYAVFTVMAALKSRMEESNSKYLQERAQDLQDVQDRLIIHLRREQHHSAIAPGTIVVSEVLTAADLLLFSRRGVLGCAFDMGGVTSHVSFMARALDIPAVVSTRDVSRAAVSGDTLIVDGIEGTVIVNPAPDTLSHYLQRRERYKRVVRTQEELAPLPAVTLDGHQICLQANVSIIEETDTLAERGAEGIGLLRTEALLLEKGIPILDEDSQFASYRRVVETVRPESTTFRLFDLGGDKMSPSKHREQNPFLGWRGLRVLLTRQDLLVPQLRAVLRASAFGPVRLLLPMVTDIQELEDFRVIHDRTKTDLAHEKIAFDPDIALGTMVEVPSVALMADVLASHVDFFSLGTNDLTQYTLAVDRGNEMVSDLYQELHPAVLRLIQQTLKAAQKHGIRVSICGELAGNIRAIPILIGLGITELSMTCGLLPAAKRMIRTISHKETTTLAPLALQASGYRALGELLDTWFISQGVALDELLLTTQVTANA